MSCCLTHLSWMKATTSNHRTSGPSRSPILFGCGFHATEMSSLLCVHGGWRVCTCVAADLVVGCVCICMTDTANFDRTCDEGLAAKVLQIEARRWRW